MTHTVLVKEHTQGSQLQRARALDLPSREAMLHRDMSVQRFWDENRMLLTDAWKEWEASEKDKLFTIDETLLDAKLRNAVEQAWENPTTETAVADLWEQVSPGVYQTQFFDPARLADLRDYFAHVADANIPLRPPYGIALNRHGAMLDQRSEGYLAAPNFQAFYNAILEKYMRPIARLLFPEVMGFDTQTFGFSIQYQPGMDTSLRLHTDASAATMNVNLNLPGEEYTGSELDLYDPATRNVKRVRFEPGVAMIHRGSVPHAAHPITSGTRTNLVFWLYGDRMSIPSPRLQVPAIDAHDRWTVPVAVSDAFAPF
ncbi:2OG-Fe(II) oxygenase [Enterovibrio norvegicus]|uniref:2OG-Fe(II) oxygenase family protein n=1 Tax=Enterovibrio norvegicus TaxID=188144 RepID=UPI0002DF87CF|nr:2OG-Fe(II) oxygenase family protein [Enterovibrio norvegicus]OEE63695.1 2OG-Fe(II) oxygenase [Enterovibrio norvegicus]